MKIEKGVISSSQLTFMIIGFLQANNLLLVFSSRIVGHDSWLAILVALVISIPIVLSYATLAKEFSGKTLVQISDIIYGVYLGKVISISYILIFLLIFSIDLRIFSDFLKTYIMPETPIWALLTLLTFLSAWAVRGGIEVIARCSFIIIVIASIIIFSTFMFLLGDMEFSNFLPIFDLPLIDFIQGIHINVSLYYLEIIIFLMIMAFVNKTEQVRGSMLWGLILGGVSLLILEVRNVAVLGIVSDILASPSFSAVRFISVAEVFTRLEMFVVIMLITTVFLKVSIMYYATVLGLAQTLQLRSYLPLVTPIGIIAISLSIISGDSSMELLHGGMYIWPVFILPLQLFPVLSLIIVKLRKKSKKQGANKK